RGQPARHDQPGGEPGIHGEPPEQGGWDHVHIPVAGGVHSADRDRESPHERRQQVGYGRGRQQGQNVFTHGLTMARLGLHASVPTLGHPGPGRVPVGTVRARATRGRPSLGSPPRASHPAAVSSSSPPCHRTSLPFHRYPLRCHRTPPPCHPTPPPRPPTPPCHPTPPPCHPTPPPCHPTPPPCHRALAPTHPRRP